MRAKAASTSTRGSGTASSVAIACASSPTALNRAWHSPHVSRCDASTPTFASGSSNIRRSVPSLRCATGYLLAQRCFRAPQQSSYLTDADAERLRDLGVAEPARAKHEHSGGLGRHVPERFAHPPPVLIHFQLLLRVERPLAFLDGLRKLALLAAPSPAQAIQRGVSGGPVQPSGCV